MGRMIFSLRVNCHVAHLRVLIGKILDETYENLLMKYHVTLVTLLVYLENLKIRYLCELDTARSIVVYMANCGPPLLSR